MKKLIQKIINIKNSLTKIGNKEPLSKISLIIILLLDIAVLTTINNGLSDQDKHLTHPRDYISYKCQEIITKNDTAAEKSIEDFSNYWDNYYLRNSSYKQQGMHPACQDILRIFDKARSDTQLSTKIQEYKNINKEIKSIDKNFSKYKGVYDSSRTIRSSKTNNIDNLLISSSEKLNSLTGQLEEVESEIIYNRTYKTFWNEINEIATKYKDTLDNDMKKYNIIYPLKKLFLHLIFLFPLFIITYLWNTYSLKKDNHITTLISSHLLFIIFIPIFFRIVDLITCLIPKHLLKQIWEFLVKFNITIIWHYASIIIFIAIAMGLIYIAQKKLFSHKKLIIKRLSKNLCFSCGNKLPNDLTKFCPHCGEANTIKCTKCNGETYKNSLFCHLCGKEKL